MWKFSGNIGYSCEECQSSGAISVGDFEIECVGGDERQMGPELCYELAYEFSCPDCDNEISLKFYVYEYPVNCLNFIDNQVWCEVRRLTENRILSISQSCTQLKTSFIYTAPLKNWS